MSEASRRLAGFTLVLAGSFGFSYALGEKLPGHDHTNHSHTVDAGAYQLSADPDGKYTLRGIDGRALTDFTVTHQAYMHLVAVRPDLSEMAHLHPAPAADGAFIIDPPDGGPWQVWAEAVPASGPQQGRTVVGSTTIGADRPMVAHPLPQPVADEATDDVRLTVDTVDGQETVSVSRQGMRFTVTAPRHTEAYLGAPAHLVAIRAGDLASPLAYNHLHPVTTGPDQFFFDAATLTDGTYQLFLQFTYAGRVLTVPMTMERG